MSVVHYKRKSGNNLDASALVEVIRSSPAYKELPHADRLRIQTYRSATEKTLINFIATLTSVPVSTRTELMNALTHYAVIRKLRR